MHYLQTTLLEHECPFSTGCVALHRLKINSAHPGLQSFVYISQNTIGVGDQNAGEPIRTQNTSHFCHTHTYIKEVLQATNAGHIIKAGVGKRKGLAARNTCWSPTLVACDLQGGKR